MSAAARKHAHPVAGTIATPEKCVVPDCARDQLGCRGLCSSCYQNALKMIAAKETTWDELESMGLAKPKSLRAAANPLRKAFYQRKKKK